MKKSFLCRSKNGKKVYFDPVHSHAATHFESTPQLRSLAVELIENMALEDKNIATHMDMGRIVGTCDVVKVDTSDDIVYGIRKNCDREGHMLFTKSRKGNPCSTVALHLVRQKNDSYILSSVWIGTFGDDDEPFPNSPEANERSKEFWNKHAFVLGSQEIQSGTLKAECPW